MHSSHLTVREMNEVDIPFITNYWLSAEPGYLQGMGVDLEKMPAADFWVKMLTEQLAQDYSEKKSYCTIWEVNGRSIGHCNVNKIRFGKEAYLHLHILRADDRGHHYTPRLLKMSMALFFKNLELEKICCEPYSLNPSPNGALPRAGFRLLESYSCIPGFLNFEQQVNHWQITKEEFQNTNVMAES